jgi:protocatechuate 3,4-dioxygenase beta subunit
MLPAILLMALFAAAAGAQPGAGVISGTVAEAATGDAVRKAVVRLTWQGTPQAWALVRTDSSGRFRFENLPAGKYALRATKAGVGAAVYGANSVRELGEVIELADGQTRDGVTLRFIHSASISGRVVDTDGDPIAGTGVSLMRMGRNMGERVPMNYRMASTNDRGEYRITNIDPGEYYPVIQSARGWRMGLPTARQFYGGAREIKDAAPIVLRGGESLTGIDFHATLDPLVRLHGRVMGVPDLNPSENHRPGFAVSLNSEEPGSPGWGQGTFAAAPDFRFDFGEIPPGRYRLFAGVPGPPVDGKPHSYSASQLVDIREGIGDLLLNLSPGSDLKGQLRIEGNGAPPVTSFNIVLGTRGLPSRRNVSARPAADGHFTLSEVTEGEWALAVNPLPRGAFVKSALLGDKDVRFTFFELGRTDAALNIVLSMNSGKVEGEVDAAGADSTRAGILLAPYGPLHNLTRFYYNTPAGADGKFKFTGIPPGKYKVFALEKMAAVNFRSPEATDNLDSLGTEIDVAEGASVQVRPKLIPIERAREALP